MITRQQAITASAFHYLGQDGKGNDKCYRWRRNGATQTWKTRPDDFRTPVKYGMREFAQITQHENNGAQWHTEEDCPRHVTYTG